MWEPSQRYPDTSVSVLDPSFNVLRLPLASVERLATGCRWSEGPVYFADGRYLLWSDIPNDRILKWEEETGAVSVFRKTSWNANGNTRDRQGRLVTCEHRGRRVTRTEYDGSITVLMDSHQGKRLNSPNDVVVKSDGSIWFTDPVFGISGYYEGEKAESELTPAVWRIDGQTGQARMMADGIEGPNGLAFSPDESILYVVASRAAPNRLIRAFDVVGGGERLANNRVFIDAEAGTPDGFRVDVEGNLWCGWGMGDAELDGVRVFNRHGAPIGHIALPERCANLCFGGRFRNRLFMAASHGLYALYVNTQGVAGG
ncbi:SMP-30/gluconolactonase/LRE family protein [Rhodopila globiformis]|uniref:Gluconolactonase n=1 Tax=Rhodopila globiformis TaxID=1071 RepID=A0A2S6N4A9_RHOGL|nr:SMP-30/gluconolactonase/LRE family protein [Rhodopila globiformis]PPQ29440.1 gluconolactonase [Rhodopila globiformis]